MNAGQREEVIFTADNKELFDCIKNIIMDILTQAADVKSIKTSSVDDTAYNIVISYYHKLGDSWKTAMDKV